jgi:hypothetical protein
MAFVFLNDFDSYAGSYLKKHMKVHHSEISSDDHFMMFTFEKLDYKTWYTWTSYNIILYAAQAIFNFLLKKF